MSQAASAPSYDAWLPADRLDEVGRALGDPEPVRRRRAEAREAFRELAIEPNPTYRGYSNIAGADLAESRPTLATSAVPLPPLEPNTLRIVHDGSGTRVELPEALRAAGVKLRTLPEIWATTPEAAAAELAPVVPEDKLTAFARALTNRAVELTVPDRCPLPVRAQEITVLSQGAQAISVRRTISAGSRARVLYSEEIYSASGLPDAPQRLYGSTTDLSAGEDASVHFLTVHAPDVGTVGLYQRRARAAARARLAWVWAGFGGLRTRSKMLSELVGHGSSVDDLQTFYGQGDQAYDSSVQMTHIGQDTHGQSITRGLFTDQARGVSRGLVRIEKEARKTLSFLSEHAMLLSRGARSDTIPILEILCRDVKATHSSSVAPVDPEKVFYLESRGLPRGDAIRTIGEGFLSHVLERAPIADLREHLYPLLAARWDRRPVAWEPSHYPALPALSVNDAAASDEWRFDAKLR
jgi:Fe-S cluster assembly protein SufD